MYTCDLDVGHCWCLVPHSAHHMRPNNNRHMTSHTGVATSHMISHMTRGATGYEELCAFLSSPERFYASCSPGDKQSHCTHVARTRLSTSVFSMTSDITHGDTTCTSWSQVIVWHYRHQDITMPDISTNTIQPHFLRAPSHLHCKALLMTTVTLCINTAQTTNFVIGPGENKQNPRS